LSIFKDQGLNIAAKIRQLLPAQPCVLCGSMSHFGLWCEPCDAAMPYLDMQRCPICALPTPSGEVCGHCLLTPPAYQHTQAAFGYQFPVDRLIQAMKYQEQLALSGIFSEKLLARIDQTNLPDYLIPMPLHPAKLKRRGFNQALLLAKPLADALNIPLLTNTCHRLRDTPSQTDLPWDERSKNVKDAFSCEMDLTGKHVALIDDVMTTGASLNELARAVQKCGVRDISAWVVARTLPHQPVQYKNSPSDEPPDRG
jgi:ComF family protein